MHAEGSVFQRTLIVAVLIVRVAGLDLSLRAAGVAVLDDQRQVATYTIGAPLKKDASLRKKTWRNIEITNSIVGIMKRHHVELVGLEDYAFSRRSSSSHVLAELGGLVKAQLLLLGIGVPIPMTASSMRKFMFGSDISDKDLIRSKLCDMGFTQPKNTDESDALVVALVIDAYANNRAQYYAEHELNLFDRIDQRTAPCSG